MRRGRSTGNQTREEAAWVADVKRAGCLCCAIKGYHWDEDGPLVEAHHLLSGGIRRGHLFTIGLCQWHHRGARVVDSWSLQAHRLMLGPALSEGSVTFHKAFGSDESLYEMQKAYVAQLRRFAA